MATPRGLVSLPTGTVATTVLVAVSITDTVPKKQQGILFVTYAWVPSGVMATPKGSRTGTVATTVLVAVSITDTPPEILFATYAWVPSGVMATPMGRTPTGTVATTVLVAVSITD